MPNTFNIASTFGLVTPTGAETNESSESTSIETAEVVNESNEVVKLLPKKLVTTNARISGKGQPDFSIIASGVVAIDTTVATSVEQSETNDGEVVSFTIEGIQYSDLS